MWKVYTMKLNIINTNDDPDDDGGEWTEWIEVDVY